jgi:TP901 family phage tail tape measure protein
MNESTFIGIMKIVVDNLQAKKELKEISQEVFNLAKQKIPGFELTGATRADVARALKQFGTETKKATGYFGQMVEAGKRALIVAPVWMAIRGAIQLFTSTVSTSIGFLVELETAMARIKIVGKGTAEEYRYLQSSLVNLAYAYGTTASEAASAAVLFAQQGKNVQETIALTRTAMLTSAVLGTDIKTAVNDMTAALEGFDLTVGDSTAVLDKWINVEKQFAVTSKDLADATKVAGASAHQLGLTLAEFLGDVTAVVEVTRKSGSEAARGLSFIYARLFTTGKDTIQQLVKVPYYLDETGKSTEVVSKRLRGTADILGDLALKWDTLSKGEKLQVATALGSMRQMTVLNALMQNYNASIDARITALTSAGSAEKAFYIIQETTAYKVKQLSSAWNVFTAALGDTSQFKGTLSFYDKLLIGLTAVVNYRKAYDAVLAREIQVEQLAQDTRKNEINSVKELIELRNKLAKAPQTPANIGRQEAVNTMLTSISKKEPEIKAALTIGTPAELDKAVKKLENEMNVEVIKIKIRV